MLQAAGLTRLEGIRHAFFTRSGGVSQGVYATLNGGVGSKRYKVTFTGPGGHSLGDFGIVNPAYAMANAMVAFGRMKVPAEPKTVYNVGIVEGGDAVPGRQQPFADDAADVAQAARHQDVLAHPTSLPGVARVVVVNFREPQSTRDRKIGSRDPRRPAPLT